MNVKPSMKRFYIFVCWEMRDASLDSWSTFAEERSCSFSVSVWELWLITLPNSEVDKLWPGVSEENRKRERKGRVQGKGAFFNNTHTHTHGNCDVAGSPSSLLAPAVHLEGLTMEPNSGKDASPGPWLRRRSCKASNPVLVLAGPGAEAAHQSSLLVAETPVSILVKVPGQDKEILTQRWTYKQYQGRRKSE